MVVHGNFEKFTQHTLFQSQIFGIDDVKKFIRALGT